MCSTFGHWPNIDLPKCTAHQRKGSSIILLIRHHKLDKNMDCVKFSKNTAIVPLLKIWTVILILIHACVQDPPITPIGAKGDLWPYRGALEQTRGCPHSDCAWHYYTGGTLLFKVNIDFYAFQDWLNAIPECSDLVVSMIAPSPLD